MRILMLSLALLIFGSINVSAQRNKVLYEAVIASYENMDGGVLPIRYQSVFLRWELAKYSHAFTATQRNELNEIFTFYLNFYCHE